MQKQMMRWLIPTQLTTPSYRSRPLATCPWLGGYHCSSVDRAPIHSPNNYSIRTGQLPSLPQTTTLFITVYLYNQLRTRGAERLVSLCFRKKVKIKCPLVCGWIIGLRSSSAARPKNVQTLPNIVLLGMVGQSVRIDETGVPKRSNWLFGS